MVKGKEKLNGGTMQLALIGLCPCDSQDEIKSSIFKKHKINSLTYSI